MVGWSYTFITYLGMCNLEKASKLAMSFAGFSMIPFKVSRQSLVALALGGSRRNLDSAQRPEVIHSNRPVPSGKVWITPREPCIGIHCPHGQPIAHGAPRTESGASRRCGLPAIGASHTHLRFKMAHATHFRHREDIQACMLILLNRHAFQLHVAAVWACFVGLG
jgi:hypothetical protein